MSVLRLTSACVVASLLTLSNAETVSANQLIGGNFSVGDGVFETITIAGDGTGDYESARFSATLTLGENGGSGTVNVTSGATLEVTANSSGWRSLYVGYRDNSTGTLNVSGAGSLAKFGSGISVGYISAPGTLLVENGGRVESSSVQIAGAWTDVPTTGEITVTGNGSTWENRSVTVGIGNGSDGELNVSSGGLMTTIEEGYIGFGSGAYGKAIVNGFNSRWEIGTNLRVGGRGNGDLEIGSRSEVTATDGYIAMYASSTSNVDLDGFDSKLLLENDLYVGGRLVSSNPGTGGNAQLNIGDGSEVRVGGTLNLFNPGTINLAPNGDLWVDELRSHSGGGTLNAATGSVYANALTGFTNLPTFGYRFSLGHTNGNATLTIPEGDSFDVGEILVIGEDTTSLATLNVEGNVSAPFISLGLFDEATGRVTVTGPSASLEATEILSVGLNGSSILEEYTYGELQVLDGATATAPEVYIGRYGGTGHIRVDDATLNATTLLEVGGGNEGSLRVQNGGIVTAGDVSLGDDFNSTGTVNLTTGAQLMATSLDIGGRGTGEVIMTSGSSITSNSIFVGDTASLSARDSATRITSNSLFVSAGGLAEFSGGMQADLLSASVSGTLRVDNATVNIADSPASGTLAVRGRVNLLNGGTITSQRGDVGATGQQRGVVSITGPGSRWTIQANDRLFVGGFSDGNISILQGGHLEHAGDLFLGVADLATEGQLNLAGGTAHVAGNLFLSGGIIDGQAIDVQSSGTLIVSRSSDLTVDGSIISFEGGQVYLSLSALETPLIDIATHGGMFTFDRSTLSTDAFFGDLDNQGGMLKALTFGSGLTVDGIYSQDSVATLQLDITGTEPGEHDQLNVTGTATLNGALSVDLVNNGLSGGAPPQLGDVYELVTAGGGLTVDLDGLLLPTLAADLDWQLLMDTTTLSLAVVEATLAGDFNADGTVDAADYTVWRQNLGASAGTLQGDSTGRRIGQAQFALWRANYGATSASESSTAATVPEPAAWLLTVLFLSITSAVRGQRSA